MLYGEIIGGALVVPPDGTGKPVVETEPPDAPEGYEMKPIWRDDGERIVRAWEAVPREGTALDDRERERIKTTQALAEQQRQTNLLVDGMRQSLDASCARIDVIVTEIHGSRDGSKKMGGTVDRIDQTTQHTDTLVEDIHRHILGGDGE